MKVLSRLNNYRSSARKVREVAPVIMGLDVAEAISQLENLKKGCAQDLKKLLQSAVANATNNNGLDKENLVVSSLVVQEARTLKRWMPRAYGRASSILKRSCHVILTVEEKEEGKGRKKVAKPQPKEVDRPTPEAKEKEVGSKIDQEKDEQQPGSRTALKEEKAPKSDSGRKIFRRKSF